MNITITVSIILLFSLDIATDVATGVELILNDNPYCKFYISLFIYENILKYLIIPVCLDFMVVLLQSEQYLYCVVFISVLLFDCY